MHSVRDSDGYGLSDLGMVGVDEFFPEAALQRALQRTWIWARMTRTLTWGQAVHMRLVRKKGGMTQAGGEWRTGASAMAAKTGTATKGVEEGKMRR